MLFIKPILPLSALQIKPLCSRKLFLFWFMKTDTELIQPRFSFRKKGYYNKLWWCLHCLEKDLNNDNIKSLYSSSHLRFQLHFYHLN